MFRCLLHLAVAAALPLAAQVDSAPAAAAAVSKSARAYVLGPDDQISIRVPDADEISEKPVRVDMSGNIRLPMVGRLHAAGLTAEQLEARIAGRLGQFLNAPDVSVSILEFRSQPVSVIGAVKTPGVYQLQGRKTLVEILSLAGGLADDAGHTINITRRLEHGPIPLTSAHADSSGRFSVADLSLEEIVDARNPVENIVIAPDDVISVPRADMIYVVGQVQKAGGFVLRERETLSVLQALSLAGGLDKAASPKNARILRSVPGASKRVEIAVHLGKIMDGESGDVPLQADDVLFIPASGPKKALARAAEAALQITTGVVIYRR